jgi:hypothetical protein
MDKIKDQQIKFMASNMTNALLADSNMLGVGVSEILAAIMLNIEFFRNECSIPREDIIENYNSIADRIEKKLEAEARKVVQFKRSKTN